MFHSYLACFLLKQNDYYLPRRRNSAITWDADQQMYIATEKFIFEEDDNPNETPQLILEVPSDSESGNNVLSSSTPSSSNKKPVSNKEKTPPLKSKSKSTMSQFRYHHRRGRRASHAADFLSTKQSVTKVAAFGSDDMFLFPHKTRLQSLGAIDTRDSITVRTFAIEGHRVVNKGDVTRNKESSSSW